MGDSMTFLNVSMLFGLMAITIPILIHLMNRSKPRPIEWGAMQFLVASMTARSRRVKIEDGILLCLRCLALTALALAMARPFLPSMSAVPWVLILPGMLLAVLCAGIATVIWPNVKLRGRLMKTAAVLLIIAVFGWAVHRGQFEDLDAEGERILTDDRPPVDSDQASPRG